MALVIGIDDEGEPEFEGTTEVEWDNQRTETDASGGRLFVDENGGVWPFGSLKKGVGDE
ncbi:hypothetical protein [Aeromonas salmonicida]|uniref:hypothetical protein n=1 Tax=Aeromonas salmonicida TaxID=645 RepID=UPI003D1D4242